MMKRSKSRLAASVLTVAALALSGRVAAGATSAPAVHAASKPSPTAGHTATPVPAGDPVAGKVTFARCAGCHGPTAIKHFKTRKASDKQWAMVIKQGKKPGMPAFPSLSEADIRNVITYVRALHKH